MAVTKNILFLFFFAAPPFHPPSTFLSRSQNESLRQAEVSKCTECVSNSAADNQLHSFSFRTGSCEPNRCSKNDTESDSANRCCGNVECCVTDGCESPDDLFTSDVRAEPVPCDKCCEDVVLPSSESSETLACIVNSWTPPVGDSDMADATSWYNTQFMEQDYAICQDCAPCAICSARSKAEIDELGESALVYIDGPCTESVCKELKGMTYFQDPCVASPNSCPCFCQLANSLLDQCPHLADGLYLNETKMNITEEMVDSESKSSMTSNASRRVPALSFCVSAVVLSKMILA